MPASGPVRGLADLLDPVSGVGKQRAVLRDGAAPDRRVGGHLRAFGEGVGAAEGDQWELHGPQLAALTDQPDPLEGAGLAPVRWGGRPGRR